MFFRVFNGGNMSTALKRIISLSVLFIIAGTLVLLRFVAYDVFMNIVPILVAILVFLFIVLVHELGHFLAAKACGI